MHPLPQLIEDRARRLADRPFLRVIGGAERSYGEIEHRSRKLANGLKALEIGHGDRVLVMLGTSVEFVEAWFAINRLGAVLVPVNTGFVGDYLANIINDADARVIIAGRRYQPALAAVLPELPGLRALVDVDDGAAPATFDSTAMERIAFAELMAGPERGLDVAVAPRDIGAIIYTSGTTGRSKGVLMPHGQLYMNPRIYIDQLGLGQSDVLYSALPLFHANALLLGVFGALLLESRVALSPHFSASRWLQDIRETGATATNLLGVMVDFILKQPEGDADHDNPLRIATAVPTAPDLGPVFEKRFGVQLIELYGSTELNCPIYHPRGEPRRARSCGRPVSEWYECRLVDPETDEEVAPGQPGELVVRPRRPWMIMADYHNRPEDTVAAWRNLWFHTGDVMRQDEDGYFYFLDRAKDAIRRRGENISSFEVEEVLRRHEAVLEAAVVGIASPFNPHEQEVKAHVALRPGAVAAPEDIARHCAARMPDFARPRFIEIMDALPKTPTQKVRKQELRERGVTPATWVSPDADGRRRAG
ncbi:AMP-binding protein [Rhodoligotrophos defluvii]|uniref:AMP-binding protein n=1 Tax=Rhodoligotrophos defluvii TaxID=2561934 RepID=UPI0010CA00F9|nr:AMP-binding protein [Rhodoligotrophos defluvii]